MRNGIDTDGQRERDLRKDERTLVAMARIYCHGHRHIADSSNDEQLCHECFQVVEYALERTKRCPHEHKGTCDTCTIQCYKPAMRQRIREIMAYSGPRMMFHHPLMAVRHLAKKRRSKKGLK